MATRRLLVEIVGDDRALQQSLGRAGASTTAFGEKASAVGKKLTTHLTLPIVAVGAVAGKMAVDFQNSMELLHTQAGVSESAIAGLSKSVLALAGPTATAPETLATGLYHLASQGLRGAKAMDALRIAAEGAKMGQANLEDVTNALGAVISSKIKGVTDLNQAMGQLNATVGAGDMRMQDLADAFGTGLAANAALAQVKLRDVNAALAVFGDNNIRGAHAGTLLGSAIRLMSAPSGTAAKALESVGIGAGDLAKRMAGPGGLPSALEFLKKKMEDAGLSSIQQGQLLTQAFGGKQATGVKLLIGQLERLHTKVEEVGKGGSRFAQDWASYTKTTAYHLASMGAQMQATGVTIGTILLPVVAKIADFIGRLAARFEALSPTVQKVILVAAGLAAAIGPVISIVGALATAITFLAANPVVLLVAGLAAVVAAFAAAILWPDKFKEVLERMGVSAKTASRIVSDLTETFRVIKEVVQAVWPTIKEIISRNLEEIKGIINVIGGLIHGDWSQVWQGIKQIVGGVMGQIRAILHGYISILGSVASAVGNAIWNGIKAGGTAVLNWLIGKLNQIVDAYNKVLGWLTGNINAIPTIGAGGNSRGAPASHLGGPAIPGHAAGGIFTRPHLAWIAEKGPEAVIPLTGPRAGMGLAPVVHIHMEGTYIGGKRQLEDEIVNGLSRWARRNGNSSLRSVLGAA